MNDRNRDLFFNDESEENVVVTMTGENGEDVDAQILAVVEVEELGKEYVAVLPLETQDEESDEMEALIFTYLEDEDGNPVFQAIEDEEEHEIVASIISQFFSGEAEEIEEEEDEDDDSESDYLDDIGDIIPGVSIQKD